MTTHPHVGAGEDRLGQLGNFGHRLHCRHRVKKQLAIYYICSTTYVLLLGNKLGFAASGAGEYIQQIKSGDIRVLATSGENRLEGVDAPTLKESNIDLVFTNWRGIVAPPGISDADRDALIATLEKMHETGVLEGNPEDARLDRRLRHRRRVQVLPHGSGQARCRRPDEARPGVTSLSTRLKGRSELGVAALLGAVGALVLFDAARLVMPYSQSDPVGPKALPIIVGSLLLVCAVMLAVNVLRGGHGEAEAGEDIDLTTRATGGRSSRWPAPSSPTSC